MADIQRSQELVARQNFVPSAVSPVKDDNSGATFAIFHGNHEFRGHASASHRQITNNTDRLIFLGFPAYVGAQLPRKRRVFSDPIPEMPSVLNCMVESIVILVTSTMRPNQSGPCSAHAVILIAPTFAKHPNGH